MAKFDYDCSGWATKAKTKCYDGLTIAPNAFQECDGKVVTMVYNHDHDNLENVLGHCLLENRPGGMYCYAKFNDILPVEVKPLKQADGRFRLET